MLRLAHDSPVDAADDVRRHAQRVERQAEQIARRAAHVAVAAKALRAGHGARIAAVTMRRRPSRRTRSTSSISGSGRIAADLVVEPLRDQQPLVAVGQAQQAQRSATSRSSRRGLSPRRRARSGRPPRAGGRRPLSTRSMKADASRSQPGSRTVSACRNSSQGKRARAAPAASCEPRPPARRTQFGAGADRRSRAVRSLRAAIDDDHLAHEPIDGRRHQRRQRLRPASSRRSGSE